MGDSAGKMKAEVMSKKSLLDPEDSCKLQFMFYFD